VRAIWFMLSSGTEDAGSWAGRRTVRDRAKGGLPLNYGISDKYVQKAQKCAKNTICQWKDGHILLAAAVLKVVGPAQPTTQYFARKM
jgi:hypothetical protein